MTLGIAEEGKVYGIKYTNYYKININLNQSVLRKS